MSNRADIDLLAQAVRHLIEAVRVLAAGNPTPADETLYWRLMQAENRLELVSRSSDDQ